MRACLHVPIAGAAFVARARASGMGWLFATAVLCLAGLLGGCATETRVPAEAPVVGAPAPADPHAWQAQQVYAGAAIPFEVIGKVGMPRGSANLRWRQQGERFDLRFWGPFGAGAATIEGDPSWVRFVREDVRREGDPVVILRDELGWRVPVAALAWWVRGLPAPDAPVAALGFDGSRLAGLRQAGWTIAIERYAQQADGGWLPEKLTATGEGGRFTLVLQAWNTGAGFPPDVPAPAAAPSP